MVIILTLGHRCFTSLKKKKKKNSVVFCSIYLRSTTDCSHNAQETQIPQKHSCTLCLDMKYPIIAKVFFSRTEPLDTAKTCHKGPHEHNQDLKLLAPQMKLKAKKKKSTAEFDPRCTLFFSQSRHFWRLPVTVLLSKHVIVTSLVIILHLLNMYAKIYFQLLP